MLFRSLRKTNADKPTHAILQEHKHVAGESAGWRKDKNGIVEEYARKQRDEIVRALSECRGRVGGADGAAVQLGINRTTLLSRMKKFDIQAKQYA